MGRAVKSYSRLREDFRRFHVGDGEMTCWPDSTPFAQYLRNQLGIRFGQVEIRYLKNEGVTHSHFVEGFFDYLHQRMPGVLDSFAASNGIPAASSGNDWQSLLTIEIPRIFMEKRFRQRFTFSNIPASLISVVHGGELQHRCQSQDELREFCRSQLLDVGSWKLGRGKHTVAQRLKAGEAELRTDHNELLQRLVSFSGRSKPTVMVAHCGGAAVGGSFLIPVSQVTYEKLRSGVIRHTNLTLSNIEFPSPYVFAYALAENPSNQKRLPEFKSALTIAGTMHQLAELRPRHQHCFRRNQGNTGIEFRVRSGEHPRVGSLGVQARRKPHTRLWISIGRTERSLTRFLNRVTRS